jgi:hypothetical protein
MVVAEIASFPAPEYHAVSYVWGDSPRQQGCLVEVDGVDIEVSPNLRKALYSLRLTDATRTLWVDAICINQKNEAEKSGQVAMMAEIYKKAELVVVFLGDDDIPGSMEPLFSFFNRIGHRGLQEDSRLDLYLERLEIEKPVILKSFIDLCSLPWWNRLWIQQEFVSAQRAPIFQFGRLSVAANQVQQDFESLRAGVSEVLQVYRTQGTGIANLMGSINVQDTMEMLFHVESILQLRPSSMTDTEYAEEVAEIFASTGRAECKDARDLVYGRRSFFEPLVQDLFAPDYTQPCDVVFERLAIWLIMFEGTEAILTLYPHRQSDQLPSWVPDFSRRRQSSYLSLRTPPFPKYGPRPVIHKGILAIRGYQIDQVHQVYAPGDTPGLQLIINLWNLDNLFSSFSKRPEESRCKLSEKLSGLYEDASLLKWCTSLGSNSGLANCVEQVTDQDLRAVVNEVLQPILDSIKVHQETLFADYNPLEEDSDATTRSLDLAQALSDIYLRLTELSVLLVQTDNLPDFLGASLFDVENLLRQIQEPYDTILPDAADNMESNTGADIDTILQHYSESLTVPRDEPKYTVFKSSLPENLRLPVDYGNLRAAVADAASKEELKLRIAILTHIATTINASLDEDGNWLRAPLTQEYFDSQNARDIAGAESLIENFFVGRSIDDGDALEQAKELQEYKDVLQIYKDGGINTPSSVERLRQQARHIAELLRGRTFFSTARWGLVGVGTPGVADIRPGDELIMPARGWMPLLLRPIDQDENDDSHARRGNLAVIGSEGKEGGYGDAMNRPTYYELVGYGLVKGLVDGSFLALGPEDRGEERTYKIK